MRAGRASSRPKAGRRVQLLISTTALTHAPVNQNNLQQVQPIKRFNVDLSKVGLAPGDPIFFTAINTDRDGERIFIGGFKKIQFITNQRDNALRSSGLAGGLYEVVEPRK